MWPLLAASGQRSTDTYLKAECLTLMLQDCKQMLENARASNAALAKSNLSQGEELTKMRTGGGHSHM